MRKEGVKYEKMDDRNCRVKDGGISEKKEMTGSFQGKGWIGGAGGNRKKKKMER